MYIQLEIKNYLLTYLLIRWLTHVKYDNLPTYPLSTICRARNNCPVKYLFVVTVCLDIVQTNISLCTFSSLNK